MSSSPNDVAFTTLRVPNRKSFPLPLPPRRSLSSLEVSVVDDVEDDEEDLLLLEPLDPLLDLEHRSRLPRLLLLLVEDLLLLPRLELLLDGQLSVGLEVGK